MTTHLLARTSKPRSTRKSRVYRRPNARHCLRQSRSTSNAVSRRCYLLRRQTERLRETTVLFFKTREPVEPVSFVHRICSDAMTKAMVKRTRHVKRLTPMTRMGKATEKSLEEVAKAVLAPVFHRDGVPAQRVRFPSCTDAFGKIKGTVKVAPHRPFDQDIIIQLPTAGLAIILAAKSR